MVVYGGTCKPRHRNHCTPKETQGDPAPNAQEACPTAAPSQPHVLDSVRQHCGSPGFQSTCPKKDRQSLPLSRANLALMVSRRAARTS